MNEKSSFFSLRNAYCIIQQVAEIVRLQHSGGYISRLDAFFFPPPPATCILHMQLCKLHPCGLTKFDCHIQNVLSKRDYVTVERANR